MIHSLGTAAQLVGVSRTTILRAIKSGKLSAGRDGKNYEIDEAELKRAFHHEFMAQSNRNNLEHQETSSVPLELAVTIAELTVTKEHLAQQLERERQIVKDLQQRLDASESERRIAQERVTALLTHQVENESASVSTAKTKERKSLFSKLFGK